MWRITEQRERLRSTTHMPNRKSKTNKQNNRKGGKKKSRSHRGPNRSAGRGSSLSTGARIGQKIGGALGGMAQHAIGTIFGAGEYQESLGAEIGVPGGEIASGGEPSVNSLVEPVSKDQVVPMMHSDMEGSVRIVRREFVSTINIQDDASEYNFKITPSDVNTFPWLSSLSRNWQQWSVLGLAAEYVPTSGYAVGDTNAALGQVAMAFKYNVNENGGQWPESSLQGMLNMNGSTSCSPAAPGVCYMECAPEMQNQAVRFVLTDESVVGSNYSFQNYFAANLLIHTEGAQNSLAFQAGQLWLTYEICLMQPRPRDPTSQLWYMNEHYTKYYTILQRHNLLSTFSGPGSPLDMIVVETELERLASLLRTPDALQARGICKALHYEMVKRQETPDEHAHDIHDVLKKTSTGKIVYPLDEEHFEEV